MLQKNICTSSNKLVVLNFEGIKSLLQLLCLLCFFFTFVGAYNLMFTPRNHAKANLDNYKIYHLG